MKPIRFAYGLLAAIAFFWAGAAYGDVGWFIIGLLTVGSWSLRELGRRQKRWTAIHHDIAPGIYAVHMIKPHGIRVIVVTIAGDSAYPSRQTFESYILPRSFFVNDPRDFADGKSGIEMEVRQQMHADKAHATQIRLTRALVQLHIRKAGDPPFKPSA